MNDNLSQEILLAAGLPEDHIAEDHFAKATSLPYGAYVTEILTDLYADDSSWTKVKRTTIELHTEGYEDKALTAAVVAQLQSRKIIHEIYKDYDKEENQYVVYFEFEEMII